MRLPDWWEFLLLALAACRLTRLAGWDVFPLAITVRDWVVGRYEPDMRPRREWLDHMLACPFCVGWWISLGLYGLWLAAPTVTLYMAVPLALSGTVGLISKNLDA